PNGAPCSDGSLCTQTDTCQGGSCSGGNPVVCTALNQCHVPGVCDPSTGMCSNPIKPVGASCTDGNACTQTDTCDQDGSCMGAFLVTCSPLDQCHNAGTCNPLNGACSNPTKPNGSACDDANSCTTDACQNGSCHRTNAVTCGAPDQCHGVGTCDPDTGACSNPTKDNGTPCSDGDACTQTDACVSGICIGDDRVVCHALDQCHEPGSCNPASGQCSNPAAPDGLSCDDGNQCTIAAKGPGGTCVGGGNPDCSTTNP